MMGNRVSKLAIGLLSVVILLSTACNSTQGVANVLVSPSAATESKETVDYEQFFTEGTVHSINIDIDEKDWASMLEAPLDEEYYSTTITVDGVAVENVGFRTKGNMTLRSVADNNDSDRYSFKIKTDKYVEDQTLQGLNEFVLNNMYSDASYMREYLSYKAMEAVGEEVPLCSYVNVSINGELAGFYLMVETVDDSFLERVFGDNSGTLYRQDMGSTLVYKEGSNYEKSKQKNGDDESKEDLKELIKVLNEMPEGEKGDIESVLDVDSALRYIAANTVMENYDSYSGNLSQNYYLYNNNGIFTVIPWDYNMSFGGFGGGKLETIDIDEPVSGISLDKAPLIRKLLAVEAYKTRYYAILQNYLDYFDNFEDQVSELKTLIRPYVEADPTKFTTLEQFDLNVTYQEGGATEASTGPEGGMPEGPPDMDGDQGERPERPEGMEMPPYGMGEPPEGMGGKGHGGPGNMAAGSSASIINVLLARLESVRTQLKQ